MKQFTEATKRPFPSLQASGKAPRASKAKAPSKPALAVAGKGSVKPKDGSTGQPGDASVQREEEASLLAAVQTISTAAADDAAGVEERLKVGAAPAQCSSIMCAPFQP